MSDDDKTRIITRGRSREPSTGPQRIGDKVVFFCMNGHKLVVPVSLGGQRGLCTKCKVPVLIPKVPAVGPKMPATFDLPVESPVEAEEPAPFPFAPPEDVVEDVPSILEGDAAAAEATDVTEEPAIEGESGEPPPVPDWPFVAEPEPAPDAPDVPQATGPEAVESEEIVWPSDPSPAPVVEPADNPVARLVARLWVERGHGGIVELHLHGGGVILPEWYEANWSSGTHGLFASQAADGSVTLTAVAWDTVEKIVVRQVQGLPDGMFE